MKKEKDNKKEDKREVAIRVEGLSKTFHVPHEKHTSLKAAAIHLFNKKSYEKFEALKGISFEVKKGEFFGIIGRNGSGKSTLLKILAGIYVPDSGEVSVSGKLSPFLELGVGFNPELTGRENLFLGGAILGLTRQEVVEKFDKIVAFAELEEFIDMKLMNYSSGMQVRLAFSLAINVHAEILLMDEVLAVGDTNFQGKCLDEFNKYKKEGKTVILVTHDIEVVKKYCDRALLLRQGKIVDIDRPDKVSNKYIEQNIADDKGQNSQKERTASKQSTKTVEILKTEILNSNLQAQTTFDYTKEIFVKVLYDIKSKITSPIFGIVIKDATGRQIFVTNTEMKKVNTNRCELGFFEIVFKIKNVLAPGRYTVSPAIADASKRILIWLDDEVSFRVVNSQYTSGGLVDLEHTILIKEVQR